MDLTPSSAAASITDSSPESLRAVYTKRLRRLLRLRHDHEEELNVQGLQLLDRAIFAAYCACRDVGAEAKAKKVLATANVALKRAVGQLQLSTIDQEADSDSGDDVSQRGSQAS